MSTLSQAQDFLSAAISPTCMYVDLRPANVVFNPFILAMSRAQVRYAAFDVLRCTVWQPGGWGLPAVFSQPGFRDFIENRHTETTKVVRYLNCGVGSTARSGHLFHSLIDFLCAVPSAACSRGQVCWTHTGRGAGIWGRVNDTSLGQ